MTSQGRVWHLLSNRWNSAITEYALSCARALAGVGYDCTFTPLTDSPAALRAAIDLPTRPINRFTISEIRALRAMATEIQPDFIFAYGGPETFLSKFLKTVDRKVVRFRGQDLDPSGMAFGPRQRWSHGHVDLVITPSERLAGVLADVMPSVPVVAVPLGVDDERFTRLAPRVWPPVRPELVILGRLDPVKGHAVFFKLMRRVLSAWPAGEPRPLLRVVGEPANLSKGHLQSALDAAGLREGEDVVLTIERVANIAALLSASALGVIPSLDSEMICRVAEEFLLCGTPVAVSGVGALEEVLAFDGAGMSWKGLSDDSIVSLLIDWIRRSVREDEGAKRQRAELAARYFSLGAMAQSLATALIR